MIGSNGRLSISKSVPIPTYRNETSHSKAADGAITLDVRVIQYMLLISSKNPNNIMTSFNGEHTILNFTRATKLATGFPNCKLEHVMGLSLLTTCNNSTSPPDNSRQSFRIITNVNDNSNTYGFNVTAILAEGQTFFYANLDQSLDLRTYTYMCISQPNSNEVWFMDQASINSISNYGTDYCRWKPFP
jgi:hypothetical protein